MALDSEFSTQPLEVTIPELGTIVMYDSSGYSEPVHQVFLYEINEVGCLHLVEWDSLDPFVEVIGGNKYESVTLTGRWGDGSDDVDPPCRDPGPGSLCDVLKIINRNCTNFY